MGSQRTRPVVILPLLVGRSFPFTVRAVERQRQGRRSVQSQDIRQRANPPPGCRDRTLATFRLSRQARRPGHTGALLLAAAIGVGFPTAALTANSSPRHIEVAASSKPMDSPTWRVTCDSAFQAKPVDNDLARELTAGCSRQTKPWRLAAMALALSSALLLAVGAAALVRARDTGPADQPHGVDIGSP